MGTAASRLIWAKRGVLKRTNPAYSRFIQEKTWFVKKFIFQPKVLADGHHADGSRCAKHRAARGACALPLWGDTARLRSEATALRFAEENRMSAKLRRLRESGVGFLAGVGRGACAQPPSGHGRAEVGVGQ